MADSQERNREAFLPIDKLEKKDIQDANSNSPWALEIQKLPWFNFSQLKNGDKIRIVTQPEHYVLEVIDAKHRIVSVRGCFRADSFNGNAVLLGSVTRKTDETVTLRTRQAAVGFSIVVFVKDGVLQLPVTQEIHLNGKQALPDLKNAPTREA